MSVSQRTGVPMKTSLEYNAFTKEKEQSCYMKNITGLSSYVKRKFNKKVRKQSRKQILKQLAQN